METTDCTIVQSYGLKIQREYEVDRDWSNPLCDRHNQQLAEVVNRYVLEFIQSDFFVTRVRKEMGLIEAQEIGVEFYETGILVKSSGKNQFFMDPSALARQAISEADKIYQECIAHRQQHKAEESTGDVADLDIFYLDINTDEIDSTALASAGDTSPFTSLLEAARVFANEVAKMNSLVINQISAELDEEENDNDLRREAAQKEADEALAAFSEILTAIEQEVGAADPGCSTAFPQTQTA